VTTAEKKPAPKPAAKKAAARATARAAHPSTPTGAPKAAPVAAAAATTSPRLVTWDEDGRTRYGLEVAVEKHDQGRTARVVPLPEAVGLDADQVKAHQP
jgi:nucleoid-associated protein YgaU